MRGRRTEYRREGESNLSENERNRNVIAVRSLINGRRTTITRMSLQVASSYRGPNVIPIEIVFGISIVKILRYNAKDVN